MAKGSGGAGRRNGLGGPRGVGASVDRPDFGLNAAREALSSVSGRTDVRLQRARDAVYRTGGVYAGSMPPSGSFGGARREVFRFGGVGQRPSYYVLNGNRERGFELDRVRATSFDRD